MNKQILIALFAFGSLANAQNQNEALKIDLQRKSKENLEQFEFYAQKQIFQNSSKDTPDKVSEVKNILSEKKKNLDFFFDGQPYFIKPTDTEQIKNSNADFLQEGNIAGLNGSFNGNGIKISVFDGGRIYGAHRLLGGAGSPRVTQKEATTLSYDSHATGVTGIIGAEQYDVYYQNGNLAGNTKGLMNLSTFDSYSFRRTILDGENIQKSVTEKLLGSLAPISNHSYGGVVGWYWENAEPTNAGEGWYFSGRYDNTTQQSYDLNGTYYEADKAYDDIVYYNPNMIVVKSAGNSFGDGPNGTADNKYYLIGQRYVPFTNNDTVPANNCALGYDCIPQGGVAKNIIIVGATEKINNPDGRYTNVADVVKAGYSSAGPRDDGAIKPDIAGVGSRVIVISTSPTGSNGLNMQNGTSFSAPQVTGVIGLWEEAHRSLFNGESLNATSAKNLLIHSALEAGNIGPDVWYGWGFADAKKGAELLVEKSKNTIIFEEKTLQNKGKNEIPVRVSGNQPLKATIVWNDPSFKNLPTTYDEAYNNRVSRLVNDLDLRIINLATNEVHYPWRLDANNPMTAATKGDNLVDNVEQVVIDAPSSGIYKIVVTNKGNLLDNEEKETASQNYSLLVTGYDEIATNTTGTTLVYPTVVPKGSPNFIIDSPENIQSVAIYDMVGRLIKQIDNINQTLYSVNFAQETTGMYIVNIKLNSQTISKNILKE